MDLLPVPEDGPAASSEGGAGGGVRFARQVEQILPPRPLQEDRTTCVRPGIGGAERSYLDPFLHSADVQVAADQLRNAPHGRSFDSAMRHLQPQARTEPHKGFESLRYMVHGRCIHEDSAGNRTELDMGDVQWLNSGRGRLHSVTPVPGVSHRAIEIWVNMPSAQRLSKAPLTCHAVRKRDVPVAARNGVEAKVLAGKAFDRGAKAPLQSPVSIVDFSLGPNATLEHPIPESWNAFLYIMEGTVRVGSKACSEGQTVILRTAGSHVSMVNGGTPARVLVAAGQPLGEEFSRKGPFVMDTEAEVVAAMWDYGARRNGFEVSGQLASYLASFIPAFVPRRVVTFIKSVATVSKDEEPEKQRGKATK